LPIVMVCSTPATCWLTSNKFKLCQ
jgi:hypothetical protein